uniref:Uncharacterized protein n=1 Tax=Arundo donax TaxID=35708 RepID=A0A0A9F161_ARUDO
MKNLNCQWLQTQVSSITPLPSIDTGHA